MTTEEGSEAMTSAPVTVALDLPPELAAAVERRLARWEEERFAERLWDRDPTLWAPGKDPEAEDFPPELADRLGWLGLPESALERADELAGFAASVRADGVETVVLMGMGGSSLAPEVFQAVLGGGAGFPRLVLLDSTHPGAVRAVEEEIELGSTLFVVASKSGTTAETMSFFHHFWAAVSETTESPGERFVAITDPGSRLAALGAERSFRQVFLAPPDVGGRYSALSVFGLVPAALVGLDVARLARGARDFGKNEVRRPASDNPGLRLGAAMAEAALLSEPRDALTFRVSPSLAAVPIWIEQLVAESLGKEGQGVLPVVDEPTRDPGDYGPDRLFVRMGLREEIEEDDGGPGGEIVRRMAADGHPFVTVALEDRWALGAAMLLWEVATAAAGAALEVQPFDQPDVELAKVRGREALEKAASEGGRTGAGGGRPSPAERGERERGRGGRSDPGASDFGEVSTEERGGVAEGGRDVAGWRRERPLHRPPGLRPPGRRDQPRPARVAGRPGGPDRRRHHRRLRPPLPPLHRPAPQGRSGHRPLPTDRGRVGCGARHPRNRARLRRPGPGPGDR